MDIDIIKLEDKIEDLLSKVPSAKSVTEYKYLVISLRTLNALYNDLTGNYYKVSTLGNHFYNKYIDSESKKLFNTRINICFSDSSFNSKLAYRLLKIYYDTDFLDYMASCSEEKLRLKDFIDIVYSFASSYDEKFYKIAHEMITDEKISVKNDSRCSTLNTIYDGDNYILISGPFKIESAGSLIHELGHVYCHRMLDNRSKSQLYNDELSFYEFYSEFVEMLFYDYVRENNIKRRDALFSENAMLASLEYYLVDLYDAYELRNISVDEDTLDVVNDAYEYSYGIVLAMYMANRYYEDKKDVITRCNEFMFMQGLNDSTKELNTLGITKDELLNGHALEKRLVRHNSDMKNIFLR